MPKTLYLLDGHALAYRAYYALTAGGDSSRFTTSNGEPTAGVYGFASVLLRIFEQEHPDYLAVAFDVGKTFRHDMYDGYKSTRAKMPGDMKPQLERMRQLVDAFNIPRLEMPGFEADDVLGSLAKWAAEEMGLAVKIITGDRDLLQLVTNQVVVNLAGGKLADADNYFPPDVKAKMGVPPELIVDYKALVGDQSDNIPGVRGVGEKTAVALLEKYGSLDGIYAHLDEISGRAHTALEDHKDEAYLSQKLALIITDLKVQLDLDKARIDCFQPMMVENLFRELEFRSLMGRLNSVVKKLQPFADDGSQLSLFGLTDTPKSLDDAALIQPHAVAVNTVLVDAPEALAALLDKLGTATQIAFDTETTSTDPLQADLVGISLAVDEETGWYIPLGHESGQQLPLQQVLDALRPALTDPKIPKVGHNLKYDYLVLSRVGLFVAPLSFDTMIAEWLVNPASHSLGLKAMAWSRLNYEMTHIETLIGKGRSQISMAAVEIGAAATYAAADAVMCLRLQKVLQADLESQSATRLFHELEMPLVPILAEMERCGIRLDLQFFDQFSDELTTSLAELQTKICQRVGEEINLNSTQQLSVALFNKLGLEPPDRTKKTASGHYSTSAEVLEGMRGQHEVVDWILEYRELEKLRSTYVDSLPKQINPQTGRVHTSFNQTGTVTGRLASTEPNLQNIPTRTELGKKVRNGFVADDGKVLLAVDYSQIELRIVAHMAQDEEMLAAFRAGLDIHTATAAAIYNTTLERVTPAQRRHAKAINFGLIYGMSPFGLTRTTDLTLAEAENFVTAYFKQFPGVQHFLEGLRFEAADKGFVSTLMGRRRYFPNLKGQTNYVIRQREEREAINAPIQGTAADIMKLAMLNLAAALKAAASPAKMLLQVHDELILEVPEAALAATVSLVKQVMENAFKLDIPLTTEARSGRSWGELEKMG